MLREIQSKISSSVSGSSEESIPEVTVALGNGHGSADAKELIEKASTNCDIPLDIQLVSEAGASVWSVTKSAKIEFPDHPPAAVAAISIGRRLQNPLFELVKVPPKSLGLGMYQHDLSEKELDEQLHLKSVDAVAAVGVDVNSGSLEILQKVPGLTTSLSEKIIKARPLEKRSDLLKISGLGPNSYQNCAGFVRVSNGPEPLDDTLVHPESYDLARWLLKMFCWELNDGNNHVTIQHNRDEWRMDWEDLVAQAVKEHGVSQNRVLGVLDNLVDSVSTIDPRIKLLQSDYSHPSDLKHMPLGTDSSSLGFVESCKPLPAELLDINRLSDIITKKGEPIRGIVGTIRNLTDFGAFIDIGSEKQGLLHVTKLGKDLQLQTLLIGQHIGIDILSVSPVNARISLGLHGCNQEASYPRNSGTQIPPPSWTRGSHSSSNASKISNKRPITTKTNGRSTCGSQKRHRGKK